jgi:hypothetical protein
MTWWSSGPARRGRRGPRRPNFGKRVAVLTGSPTRAALPSPSRGSPRRQFERLRSTYHRLPQPGCLRAQPRARPGGRPSAADDAQERGREHDGEGGRREPQAARHSLHAGRGEAWTRSYRSRSRRRRRDLSGSGDRAGRLGVPALPAVPASPSKIPTSMTPRRSSRSGGSPGPWWWWAAGRLKSRSCSAARPRGATSARRVQKLGLGP